jgi:hypothetical protein
MLVKEVTTQIQGHMSVHIPVCHRAQVESSKKVGKATVKSAECAEDRFVLEMLTVEYDREQRQMVGPGMTDNVPP